MNWGTKIFLILAVFMLCIVAAGFYMVTQDTDSLEEDDYYEQGLNYDQAYEKKQNVLSMKEMPTVALRKGSCHSRQRIICWYCLFPHSTKGCGIYMWTGKAKARIFYLRSIFYFKTGV